MTYQYNLGLKFKNNLKMYGDASCIKYPDNSSSYLEVDNDSDAIASLLLAQGLKRGDVVAIIHSKEYLSYILMIACLKVGVIYTNIDPDIPIVRFKHILDTCSPVRVFSSDVKSEHAVSLATAADVVVEDISTLDTGFEIQGESLIAAMQSIDGDAIAYIMFTSGSTGRPKGVAITHQNLIHFIHWSISAFEVKPGDVVANVNPMYFDNSVFDFYTSMFSGASLVPVNKSIVSAAHTLVKYIEQMQCTIWFSVPSLLMYMMTMKALVSGSMHTLRLISFGGEGYPKSELKKLYELYAGRVRFVNVYGPTECTCICSSYDISEADFVEMKSLPSLGRINPNFSFIILDDDNNLASEGELCLFGPNVGRGYYNHIDPSNKSFCEFTGHGYYRSRMYRTGDIVSMSNNLLYFKGRKDNQIKHMGYRIELEEIEMALGLVHGVNQVAVVYEKNALGYGKIIAYIASTSAIDASYIRDNVKNVLPVYMIPNKIVVLEHLPKNQNGKVDKVALQGYEIKNSGYVTA